MLATVFRRPLQTVRLALETFEQFGMIEVINGTITIPNWSKHQNIDGIDKIREQTRERTRRYRDRQKLIASGNVTCDVTVTERNAIEEDIEEDIDTDIENIKAAKPPRAPAFKPPTVEEVAAYCRERNNGIDPEAFVNFYKSKGWKVGKDKMTDWKAAVITWEKRDRETPPREKPKPKQYTTAQEYNGRDRKPISADALEDIKRSFGLK